VKARAWLLGGLGAALLAMWFVRHPPLREGVLLAARLFTRPDGGKLLGALRSLAVLAALNLAAGITGHAAVRRLSTELAPGLRAIVAIACGFVLIGWAVLLLGGAGLLAPPALAAILALPILAALPWLVKRAPSWPGRPSRWWWVVALALVPALLDAFVPELGWDALTYHLALPERFLREGHVSIDPFSTYSAFPQGTEMLYTLALGLDGAELAKLLNLEMGLLALAALGLLAGGVSRRCAVLAVVLLLPDPVLQWELRSAYTDLPVMLYLLLAFAALVQWSRGRSRGLLVLAGVLAGACVGVRLPALAVPVTFALAFALASRRDDRPWAAAARAAAVIGAVAAATFLPWMIRNVALTGNPVTPLLQGVFHRRGHEFFDPVVIDQQVRFAQSIGMGHGPLAFLALPWNLTMRSQPGVYAGSFGFEVAVLPVFGALAALALPVRGQPVVRAALAVSLIFAVIWFVGSQEARYLLPIFPLLALAAAAAFDHLAGAGRAVLALPAAALLWGMVPWMNRLGYEYGHALGTLPRESLESSDPSGRVAAVLRRTLPPAAKVLMVLEARAYFYRGLDLIPYHAYEGSPVLRLIHANPDGAALRCRLAALQVSHLVLNTNHIPRHPTFTSGYTSADYSTDLATLRTFLRQWSSPIIADAGVVAVALQPPPTCR
jgi:hypothetical protein